MLGGVCAISNDFVSSKLIQLFLLMLMVYLVGYICALFRFVCGGDCYPPKGSGILGSYVPSAFLCK